MEMTSNFETQRNYENPLEDVVSELSDLSQEIELKENNGLAFSESIKANEHSKYPYINDSDYAKYFAPETYNFKQFWVWSCRFVASIYWITRMKCYKNLVINSVKKDGNGNFIVKIPLSTEKNSTWTWHKIDISAYQNQRTINGSNPRILQNNQKNTDRWNGIVALAMAIWEEKIWAYHFDIHRLEGWDSAEIFLDWKTIKDISLKETIEYPGIRIDKLKEALWQGNTIIIASIKINEKDWSIETVWNNNESNNDITITKIIKENNKENIQYYDPNYVWLKKIPVDDFVKKCFRYKIFWKTENKYNYLLKDREKKYHSDDKNRNSPGMIVENTGSSNDTLRNLRWDFIAYEDGGKTIVESFGKKSEIIKEGQSNSLILEVTIWGIKKEVKPEPTPNTSRKISFSNSKYSLWIDKNKLSEKYKREKNEKYKVNLYLPKIANFMHRMIHDYIDTEAWNKENSSPFSINFLWNLVFDDDPNNVNLDKISSSERENLERERKERKKSEKIPFKKDLVCLKDRSELWIDDKETKREIVRVLNNMVNEKKFHN